MSHDSNLPCLLQKLAWALALAFGLFSAWGQLATGLHALSILLAGLWLIFQIATNVFAVAARHLFRRRCFLTGASTVAMMIATGLFSHEALTNAFFQAQRLGLAANMDADVVGRLFLVAPFLEVVASRASDLLQSPDAPSATEGEMRAQRAESVMAAAVVAAAAPGQALERAAYEQHDGEAHATGARQDQAARSRTSSSREAPGRPRAGARASVASQGDATRDRSRSGLDARRRRAIALKAANPTWTQVRIAQEMGETRSTVQRWLQMGAAALREVGA